MWLDHVSFIIRVPIIYYFQTSKVSKLTASLNVGNLKRTAESLDHVRFLLTTTSHIHIVSV